MSDDYGLKDGTLDCDKCVTVNYGLFETSKLDKGEAQKHFTKLALSFDLCLSDLILVYRPPQSDEDVSIFAIVRQLRQYGHQACYILPESVMSEA